MKRNRSREPSSADTSNRTQMVWSGLIAVIVASLALYQVFGRSADSSADSTVNRLETRTPATIR